LSVFNAALLILLAGWYIIFSLTGLPCKKKNSLFLSLLSIGMLGSAFIFVISDKIGSRLLLSHNLDVYPIDLRDNRQQRKNFIIPTFMTVMTFVFAFAIALLIYENLARLDNFILLNRTLFSLTVILLIVLYFGTVLTLVAIWTTTTAVIYKSIINQMDVLASGEKDLSKRISITSIDELGTIAGLINIFSSNLYSNIEELKRQQKTLTELAHQFTDHAQSTEPLLGPLTSSSKNVQEKVQVQAQVVEVSSKAIGTIIEQIDELNRTIEGQAASVNQASASIEQMIHNIQSINGTMDKMAQQFQALIASTEQGQQLQQSLNDQILQIEKRSKNLQEANRIISSIAGKTNLLAMNAAIEAAHAGEAGKGFSVVADEIRSLAEVAATQSKTIKQDLNEIQKEISTVVQATTVFNTSFAGLFDITKDVSQVIDELKGAMGEQQEGSSQILAALKEMNELTGNVRQGSNAIHTETGSISDKNAELTSATTEIDTSIQDMLTKIAAITESTREFSRIGLEINKFIETLTAILKDFVIE
jgi:methyl-accepting chemotaxis protein